MSNSGLAQKKMFQQSDFKLFFCHRDEFYDYVNNSLNINWREFLIDNKQVLKGRPVTKNDNFIPTRSNYFVNNCSIQLRNWTVLSGSSDVASDNPYILWSVLMQKYGLIFDGTKFISGFARSGTYKSYRFQDLVFQVRLITAGRDDVIYTGLPKIDGNVTTDTIPIKIRSSIEELATYPVDDVKNEYNGYYNDITFSNAIGLLKGDYTKVTGDQDDIVIEDEYGNTDTYNLSSQQVLTNGATDNYFWYCTPGKTVLIRKLDRLSTTISIDNTIGRYVYEHKNRVYIVLQTQPDNAGFWCHTYIRNWTDNKSNAINSQDQYIGRCYSSVAMRSDIFDGVSFVAGDFYPISNPVFLQLQNETVLRTDYLEPSNISSIQVPYYDRNPNDIQGYIGGVMRVSGQGNFIAGAVGNYETSYCPLMFETEGAPDLNQISSGISSKDLGFYNNGFVGNVNGVIRPYPFTFFDLTTEAQIPNKSTNVERNILSGRADFLYQNNKLYATIAPTTAPNTTPDTAPSTGYVKGWSNYGLYPMYSVDCDSYTKSLLPTNNNRYKVVDWVLDVNDSSIAVCSVYDHFGKKYRIKQMDLTTGAFVDYRGITIDTVDNYADHFYGLFVSQSSSRNLLFNRTNTIVQRLDNTGSITDYDLSSIASSIGAIETDAGYYRVYAKQTSTKNLLYIDLVNSDIIQNVNTSKLDATQRVLFSAKDYATNDSLASANNYIIDRYENVRIKLFDMTGFDSRLSALMEVVKFSNKLMTSTPNGDLYFKNLQNLDNGVTAIDDDDIITASIKYGDTDELKRDLVINSSTIDDSDIYKIVVRQAKDFDAIKETDLNFIVLPSVYDTSFTLIIEVLSPSDIKYKVIATDQKIPLGWTSFSVSDWSDITINLKNELSVNLFFNFTPSAGDQYEYTVDNKKLTTNSNTNRTIVNPNVRLKNAYTFSNKFLYPSIENGYARQLTPFYTGVKQMYSVVLNYPLVLERRFGAWAQFNPTQKIKLSCSSFGLRDQDCYIVTYNINYNNNTTTLVLLEV